MSHVLKLRDVIVGRCDLPATPTTERPVRAAFRPGLGWELVEPIFQLARADDDDHRARYAKARDALDLSLYDNHGTLVDTSRIDIVDDASSPSGLTISVHVVSAM